MPDLSDRPLQMTLERECAIPPLLVYQAWTVQLDRWFAQPGSVLMRQRVNEPFFFETLHENIRQPHYGRFLRLEPDRLIELAWVTGPLGTQGAETVVTIELMPTAAGTRLRLTHAGFVDEASRNRHSEAWPRVLDLLENIFAEGVTKRKKSVKRHKEQHRSNFPM